MDPNASQAARHSEIGKELFARGETERAIGEFELALGLDPLNANVHVLLSWALPRAGRIAEAEAHLEQAIELDPNLGVAYGMLGFRKQERGDFASALANFQRGVELQPRQAGSYYGIVQSKMVTAADQAMVEAMERLSAEPGVPPTDRLFLHFGLGKAYDDLARYEDAIRHYDIANRISATDPVIRSKPYDRKGHRTHVDATIARYTGEFLKQFSGYRSDSDTPILIVGMPRSGTTLVEQVISSHPSVAAGGELTFWRDEAKVLRRQVAGNRCDDATGKWVAKQYLKVLDGLAGGKPRVTDKMPINYLFLGAIHMLFPNARVVFCRRHPVDTSLSIFMTRIMPPEFSNDRGNIVFCYREHERIMAHWQAVLPADRLLEVRYEQMVLDQEQTSRRLIEFCGLPWDDACLRPEKNDRKVMTPSLWQARQPVYRTSLDRWKNYEPWLNEFRELLP